ncbi:tyrosine-protein phosphatase [Novosphingobium sp.]|uniref:tyrosine-protein phosphatase n=1 Tax=Novosphingobium sp. TaxID=1874826 RepID=UPI00333FF6B0
MNDDRVLDFEGIHNFRDYGGYPARAGRLARGRLWRSGQHAGATPADLARVRDLNIATVIDLRGDSERAAYPCLRHDEFAGEVLFHPGETASLKGRAAHEEGFGAIRTAADAHVAMLRLYQGMAWRDVLVGTWRLYGAALATRDGASLLHCLAGKDRTGVGAALIHHVLGVHHDDVIADFLLTNTAGNVEARIAALSANMAGRGLNDGAMRVIMGVEAEWLDAAFAAIQERHGSVAAYAESILGLGPSQIAAMESRLVD